MEEKTETLADRLRLARTKRSLTQVELADRAGMKQSDLSKLERGKALSTASIARLARALRVSAAWLEEGEGDIPDWTSDSLPKPVPVSLSEAELVDRLRPEWRELIFAYEELLPEDRMEMAAPMLKKAEEMRRHFRAGLAKLGIQHQPLASTGNHLPLAPPHGSNRRIIDLGHMPERRSALVVTEGSMPSPRGARKGKQ